MHRVQIEELTYGVNNTLTLYLEVHNGIFAQPWWRSIPIPGLFKSIPFDRYEVQISKVDQILMRIEGDARNLYKEGTPQEKAYLAVLHQYTVALLKAVIALRTIVVGLKGKTENRPFPMSDYKKHLAAYQDADKAIMRSERR